MDVKNWKLEDIHPYEHNPRNNNNAVVAVAKSIKEFGIQQPIVVDRNGVVIVGHTRLKAAKRLGLKSFPVVVADLDEDKARAYRIADNSSGEIATWDIPELKLELDKIKLELPELNMSMFGLPEETETKAHEYDPENTGYERPDWYTEYGDAAQHTVRTYKLDCMNTKDWTGKYDIPMMDAIDIQPTRLVGFNYARSIGEYDCGIHFYIDDYQFERVWNRTFENFAVLEAFECVLTPQFSMYLDMPLAMQVWNTFRNRQIGRMMQDYGIKAVPSLCWSDRRSFEFAFDGIPKHSTVSLSTVGNADAKSKAWLTNWHEGVDAAIERLEPKRILYYGTDIDHDFGDIEVVKYRPRKFGE